MAAPVARWWEPGSDVALLTPTGEPGTDLANAVAALHRAGAAAIADACQSFPVVDDGVLIGALAAAREQFAPLLIEPVAKCTGTDPTYAGLLLRDVFDDAEVAALGLFRSAVAKGMARRTAADRVAKVYGVPRADLGRYLTVALDPKAPPAAVGDVADETLFASIARLVDAEARGPISKAEAKETRRAAQEKEPRDAAGKYTVAGQDVNDWLAGQLTGEHLVEEKPTAAPAEPTKLLRMPKPTKLLRMPKDRPAAERAQGVRATVDREQVARTQALRELAARTNRSEKVSDVTSLVGPVGRRRDVPDHLALTDDPPVTGELGAEVAFVLPYSEAVAFLRDAPKLTREAEGKVEELKVTRAGPLVTYAGAPARDWPRPDDDDDGTPHEQAVAAVAGAVATSAVFAAATDPESVELTDAQVTSIFAGSHDAQRIRLDELKADVVRDWADTHDARVSTAHEVGYVELVQGYEDERQWFLVYTPPGKGSSHTRPVVNLAELHVRGSGVRGQHERGSRYGQETFTVDPNQPLLVEIPTDKHGNALPFEQRWDAEQGIYRTQIYLRAGDEDDVDHAASRRFGKAMSRREFADAVAEGKIRRGEDGEFTSTEDYLRSLGFGIAEDTPEPAPTALLRMPKATKLLRASTKPVDPAERQEQMRAHAQRDQAVRTHAARLLAAASRPDRRHGIDYLPTDQYTLVSDAEMKKRLGVAGDGEHMLSRGGRDWLVNRGALDPETVEVHLLNRAAEDYHAHASGPVPKMLEPMALRTDDDWHELETRLQQLLYDTEVEGIGLHFARVVDDGQLVAQVRFVAPRTALPAQNVIRWESGGPDDPNLTISFERDAHGLDRETLRDMVAMYRAQDADAAGNWGGSQDWIVNPRVRMWRVQRADDSS